MAWKKFREFCFTWFSCCAKCVPSRFTCSRTASDLRSELVLSSWLPERSYHSSEPYSCGNAASFLKVMQVRHCIHQVWPFRLHFDTLSSENDVSEKHRVWKKHTPTNTVKKNWYTYMCQDLHLHSLYTIKILTKYCTIHRKQHKYTSFMRLHAPAYTLNILDPSWKYGIHRISPRFKLLFIFRAWKIVQFHGPNSTVVAPLWLQRSWTKTCKLFVHLSSSKCFRQKMQCSNSCDRLRTNCWPCVATF